jgi:hypothetical protein
MQQLYGFSEPMREKVELPETRIHVHLYHKSSVVLPNWETPSHFVSPIWYFTQGRNKNQNLIKNPNLTSVLFPLCSYCLDLNYNEIVYFLPQLSCDLYLLKSWVSDCFHSWLWNMLPSSLSRRQQFRREIVAIETRRVPAHCSSPDPRTECHASHPGILSLHSEVCRTWTNVMLVFSRPPSNVWHFNCFNLKRMLSLWRDCVAIHVLCFTCTHYVKWRRNGDTIRCK